MKFIERWAKFLHVVTVKEIGNQVRITGIDGVIMRKYLKTLFETDLVTKMMFTQTSDTSIILHRFFIPDFIYMLTVLRHDPSCGWGGRRTIDKIVSGILKNTWYKVTTQPVVSMIDEKRKDLLKWKALPHQLKGLHMFGEKMPQYDLRGYILGMYPGTGKAQPLDSNVRTSDGWTKMGDITLNHKAVMPDGTLANITGIYPQGEKDIYRITLQDGQKTESCDEHFWKVFCPEWSEPWKVLQLKDFLHSKEDIYVPVADLYKRRCTSVRVKSIEYIGQKQAQCISVDHPDHLYITDDYIVTHNTFLDLLIATCIIPLEIAEIKIIISPKKALHLVWEKTVKTVFKKTPTCWVSDSGIKMPLSGNEYYIFNFEQLDQAIALGKHLVTHGKRYFVIVDESHNFADYKSSRTQKLVELQTIKDNIYFLWASGSPILKSAVELVSFLKCSDPRFDGDAERRFRRIYAAAPGRANQIFNHRLGNMLAYIVPKAVVSDSKPTVKELPVRLPPSVAHKFLMSTVREEMRDFIKQRLVFYADNIKDYKRLVAKGLDYHESTLKTRADRIAFDRYQRNLKMLMNAPDLMLSETMAEARTYERTRLIPSLPPMERKIFRNALSAVKNLKLKVRGEALGTVLAKRRSECAAALALYCKPELIIKESLSKTLFFASSVLPIKILEKHLKNQGFEPLLVYADTNANLTANIEAFTTDPNINPICATMQSLSEAVPVIAASTIVFLNRPFRESNYSQIVARADRLGQKYPVTVVEVTLDTGSEPNVSSSTDAILANIRELINDIVGESFAGPKVEDREYKDLIDASRENPLLLLQEEKLGL